MVDSHFSAPLIGVLCGEGWSLTSKSTTQACETSECEAPGMRDTLLVEPPIFPLENIFDTGDMPKRSFVPIFSE